eukprot:Rhum_TRINITY_DN13576_c0_g1::Rhum_TRINITY_DN13576_c0_g1_i1::g.61474::m.61474/K03424/tatD; TatD DNase family protein
MVGASVSESIGGLVDCHAHLTDPLLQGDDGTRLSGVLDDAAAAGVARVVVVSEDAADARKVLALCGAERGRGLRACVGLHPESVPADAHSAEDATDEVLRLLEDSAAAGAVVGVGECGLDFTRHVAASRELQTRCFERQIEKAVALGLPLNVHSRMAGHYAIESLIAKGGGHKAAGAVLHAFDGKPAHAANAVEGGHHVFFSVPPCFSGAPSKLVKRLPLSALLLETDSPALAAVKGEVNYPKNLTVSLKYVSNMHERTECEVADAVTRNSYSLFPRL